MQLHIQYLMLQGYQLYSQCYSYSYLRHVLRHVRQSNTGDLMMELLYDTLIGRTSVKCFIDPRFLLKCLLVGRTNVMLKLQRAVRAAFLDPRRLAMVTPPLTMTTRVLSYPIYIQKCIQ